MDGTEAVGRLVAEWQAARAELAAIEKAEHPDIEDGEGRVWCWWKGTLYRHESKAWPIAFLPEPTREVPCQH